MKLLCMDTTAKVSTVAIVDEQKVLANYQVNLSFTHSQTAMPMAAQLLTICGLTLEDIDGFAVATGPGSFTGLRIGISAIKGMAFAQNKPCISVSTLDALAQNCRDFDGYVCAVMDARCNQVYQALYHVEGQVIQKTTEDRAILLSDLTEELQNLKKSIILVGDGADLCYNKMKEVVPNLYLASPQQRYQSAASVGMVGMQKLLAGDTLTADELLPQYLRLPQAQRERQARLNLASKGE